MDNRPAHGAARQRSESYDEMLADLIEKHGKEIAATIMRAVFGPQPRKRYFTMTRSDGTRVRTGQAVDSRLIARSKNPPPGGP